MACPPFIQIHWPRWVAALLPQDCLLCSGVAGETLLCPACAAELPALPGNRCPVCAEASPGGVVCGACLSGPRHFDATVAAFRYHFPVDRLVQSLKYSRRIATADFGSAGRLARSTHHGDARWGDVGPDEAARGEELPDQQQRDRQAVGHGATQAR